MVAQLNSRYIKARPTKLFSRLISYALFEGRPVTTRGQWFNPVVFAHLSCWVHLPQIRKVQKPIFILGVGRSGTTILGILMSLHRDVGYLNEGKAIWHKIHPHEDVSGSYDSGDTRYRLGNNDVTSEMRQAAHRLYGGYLTTVFSRRVLDKNADLSFRVPFVREIFPDAKFIFLIRNGWETCASIAKWSERHSVVEHGEVHDWWGVNRRKWKLLIDQIIAPDPYFSTSLETIMDLERQVDMAAVEWTSTMREGMRLMQEHEEAIHLLRYEDLVNAPEPTLERLLQFCELPHDERFMTYARQTLRPAKPHGKFDLSPAIAPLFKETLDSLGYDAS